ncbi:Uncharacterised protein [Pantoea agglomerans]|uniref:Uncharacterized protein n=1 Tax=Enterobacter agglomerans TaxID=549 RepID=A0A379LSL7_ENTAG|nr:Uncharacterised protein [Pantoea agglomerans]
MRFKRRNESKATHQRVYIAMGGVQIYTGLTCLCLLKDYQVVETANNSDISVS